MRGFCCWWETKATRSSAICTRSDDRPPLLLGGRAKSPEPAAEPAVVPPAIVMAVPHVPVAPAVACLFGHAGLASACLQGFEHICDRRGVCWRDRKADSGAQRRNHQQFLCHVLFLQTEPARSPSIWRRMRRRICGRATMRWRSNSR